MVSRAPSGRSQSAADARRDGVPLGAARLPFAQRVQRVDYRPEVRAGDKTWILSDLPKDTRWRRTPAESESVAENAVRWLLATQRSDGSWNDCRYAYWDTPQITPNAWMAVTALAATAAGR